MIDRTNGSGSIKLRSPLPARSQTTMLFKSNVFHVPLQWLCVQKQLKRIMHFEHTETHLLVKGGLFMLSRSYIFYLFSWFPVKNL
jgi:hypothetical protein